MHDLWRAVSGMCDDVACFAQQIEELEHMADEMGVVPAACGVRCDVCGVEVHIPWDERADLPGMMEGHLPVCPGPKKDAA